MPPRLLVGIGWGTIGSAIYAACQWGMLVVLANFGSLADVGQLSLALAVTAPVFLLFGLNLRVAQATDAQGEFDIGEYFLVRAGTTVLAIIAIGLVTISWGQARQYWATVLLVASAKVSEAMTEVVIGRYQQLERFDQIGQLQISRGLFGLLAFSLVLWLAGSLNVAVAAWSVAWLALFLFSIMRNRGGLQQSTFAIRLAGLGDRKFRRLLVIAAPLGLAAVMDSLVLNVPKYFLQESAGIEQVGVFSAITYLMAIGGVAVGAIGYAVTPRLARLGRQNRKDFLALTVKATAIAFAIGVSGLAVSVVAGGPLLEFFYSSDIAKHQLTLVITMISATVWYVAGLLGCGLNGLRLFGAHAAVQAAALLATVLACVQFVPEGGVVGAAVALCIGMSVRLLGSGVGLYLMLRD